MQSHKRRRGSAILSLAVAAIFGGSTASAANYYWDTNDIAAGAGSSASGTWSSGGVTWSTDATGLSATAAYTTLNTDLLQFVAGPGASSGNDSIVVTVSGTQAAQGLVFKTQGATALITGPIQIGGSGITVEQFAYDAVATGEVSINNALSLQAPQAFTNNSSNLLAVYGSIANGGNTLTISGAGNVTLGGAISGAGGITMSGGGTLTLSPSPGSSYSGGVIINSGTVRLSGTLASTALGSSTSLLTINAGTLRVSRDGITSLHPVTLGNPDAAISVDSGMTYTQNAIVSGSGNLNVTGAGTLVLASNNTFTGQTLIRSGSVRISTIGGTPGDALRLGNNLNPVVIGAASPYSATQATLEYSGSTEGSIFPIELGSGGGAIKVTSTNTIMTVEGIISGSGDLHVTGAGSLELKAANTFSGKTIVESGMLVVGSFAATGAPQPVGTNANPLTIGTSTAYSTTQAMLYYTGPTATTAIPIKLGSGGGNIRVLTGTLTLTGGITSGALVVAGFGTLNLGRTNTYSGTTTVSSPLQVSGSITNSAVTINSGGTVSGGGVIGGTVTVNSSGILTPHTDSTSTGTLTIGGLVANTGAFLSFRLGAPGTGDLLVVNGNATLTASRTYGISTLPGFGPGTYTLMNVSGTLTHNSSYTATGLKGYYLTIAPDVTGHLLNMTVVDYNLVWRGTTTSTWSTANSHNNWVGTTTFYSNSAHVLFDDTVGAGPRNINLSTSDGNLTPASVTVDGAGDYTFSGSGLIESSASLTKNGSGTLTIANSGSNSYNGSTSINAGTVQIAPTSGTMPLGSNTITINNATLRFSRTITMLFGSINLGNANSTISVDSGFTVTLNNPLTGSGNLNLTGAGTLILTSASNSFAGQAIIQSGTLQVGSMAIAPGGMQPLGTNLDPIVIGSAAPFSTSNATLAYSGSTAISTLPIALGSGGGAMKVTNASTTLTHNGAISGSGDFASFGPGTLSLGAANTFTGQVSVIGGTLRISNILPAGNPQPLGAGSGSIVIGSATNWAVNQPSLVYDGPSVTLDRTLAVGSGGGFLTITNAATTLTVPSGISGGQFQLFGAGMLVLGGASVFTLDVNTNIPVYAGASLNAPFINVQPLGALGGNSTVTSTVIVSGRLQPRLIGSSSTLTINGSLSMMSGSTLALTLGSTSDTVNVIGTTSLTSNVNVVIKGGAGFGPGDYTLLASSGLISSTATLTLVTPPTGFTYTLGIDPTNHFINLHADALAMTWNGTTNTNWTTNVSDVNWAGTTAYFQNNANVLFDDTASAAKRTVNLVGALTAGVTVSTPTVLVTYRFQGAGSLAGASSIIKNGLGTLQIANSGSSTFFGGVVINGGVIDILSGANATTYLGADASPITINDGTLKISTLSIAASNHPMTLGSANSAINPTTASNSFTQNGVISGSGNLNMIGAGTLTLGGANVFTGQTVIQKGNLQINSVAAPGSPQPLGTNANPVVIGTATAYSTTLATLTYTGTAATTAIPVAIGSGGGAIAVATGSSLNLSGPVTGGAFLSKGNGTLTFSGAAKTYTGLTTVSIGTLIVDSSSALPATAVVLNSNSTLKFWNSAVGASLAMPTSPTSYVVSSTWANGTQEPSSIATGVDFYQVGANTGSAQPDFIMIDLGVTRAISQVTINWNELVSNPQAFSFYVAPDGATNLYNSPTNNINPKGTAGANQPNSLQLGNWTSDSAVFSGAPTVGNYTYTLSGFSGRYLAIVATTRGSGPAGSFGMRISQMSLKELDTVTQSIASLAGDAGTTLYLAPYLTLNVGTNNTSTSFLGSITGDGALSKVGTGTLTLGGAISHTGGTVVSNGTLLVNSSGPVGAFVNNASLIFASGNTKTAKTIDGAGATTVTTGTQLTANRIRQSSVVIEGSGKVIVAESSPGVAAGVPAGDDNMVSVVTTLSIAQDVTGFLGTFDLKNNDLIIDYTGGSSPLDAVEAMVKSGYNNGTWTGKGITSSTAATSPTLYHLAVADNALLGGTAFESFDGVDTSNHQQIIVKFTWIADINLDGLVNSNDAIAFATYYSDGLTGAHHMFADLNYDGVVNSNDAILFATTYNTTLAHLPEPASLGLLAMGASALLIRRRR